jgi:hypothetical protein
VGGITPSANYRYPRSWCAYPDKSGTGGEKEQGRREKGEERKKRRGEEIRGGMGWMEEMGEIGNGNRGGLAGVGAGAF